MWTVIFTLTLLEAKKLSTDIESLYESDTKCRICFSLASQDENHRFVFIFEMNDPI